MTPDEIQNAIEGMLSVQRQLQDDQLGAQQERAELRSQIQALVRVSSDTLDSVAQLKKAVDYLLREDGEG